LVERREGRHRRSQIRTETSVIRRNETRRTRAHPRRLEALKQRERVTGRRSVNVLNLQANSGGRSALDRFGKLGRASGTKRLTVGVDEGERVENGRVSIRDRTEKKQGSLGCMMNSHAPVTGSLGEDSAERGERRLPRKTCVETDHRRTNREGKGVWTTGVGTSPSLSSLDSTGDEDRRWSMEERSDPSHNRTKEDVERSFLRSTRGVKTVEATWNERRRPTRYDYYREGHAINRASKVMAKASVRAQGSTKTE